jgi:hypothetical protein
MHRLSIKIKNSDGAIQAEHSDTNFVNLVYTEEYRPGDYVVLSTSKKCSYLVIQLDDVMNPSFVYMKETEYTFVIPFEEKRVSYNPKAFTGNTHVLKARIATEAEINADKNLALNEYDYHENSCCFPHAFANVETRGESVFAARNAIDGNTANHSHGPWPYESWGINMNPDAEITVEFGRVVDINKIVLFTRADFPHDNWWKQVKLTFSDSSSQTVYMEKSDQPHTFKIEKKQVSWIKMNNMVKDENDSSPFPALSQIEVYGTEALIR